MQWVTTARWVDATVKTAADESKANATQLSAWYVLWRDEVMRALQPLATLALGQVTPVNSLGNCFGSTG